MTELTFDVIVVGGGHAGCEAAAAAARMGARTALVTHTFATIGEMSCNPAIGGLGKGHLVREIDALDGLMGRVADAAGIQFRLLNRSKGPAVQGPRAQIDRKLYRQAMQAAIRETASLEVVEGGVEDLIVADGRVCGVALVDGRRLGAGAVVLTTGTFLNGLIHLGEQKIPAGRVGEAPALRLSERLYGLGLQLGRLKTGTPPRLLASSIDWGALEKQAGDDPPVPFSFLTKRISTPQIACAVTRTTEATHAVIRENLHRSAMYSGQIASTGPALLPLDRGQDRALRRPRRAPGLPRAGGPRRRYRLSQRSVDLAAGRGAGSLHPHDAWAGKGRHQAAGLRHRVRLRRSARALGRVPRETSAGAVPRRTDQRHHGLRGGGRAGDCRRHQRGAARGRRRAGLRRLARRRLSRRHGRRPRDARGHRALSHVHLARRVPAAAQGRQRRPAADACSVSPWVVSAPPAARP